MLRELDDVHDVVVSIEDHSFWIDVCAADTTAKSCQIERNLGHERKPAATKKDIRKTL